MSPADESGTTESERDEQRSDKHEDFQAPPGTAHLRLRDVRALFRLINEIRELAPTPRNGARTWSVGSGDC